MRDLTLSRGSLVIYLVLHIGLSGALGYWLWHISVGGGVRWSGFVFLFIQAFLVLLHGLGLWKAAVAHDTQFAYVTVCVTLLILLTTFTGLLAIARRPPPEELIPYIRSGSVVLDAWDCSAFIYNLDLWTIDDRGALPFPGWQEAAYNPTKWKSIGIMKSDREHIGWPTVSRESEGRDRATLEYYAMYDNISHGKSAERDVLSVVHPDTMLVLDHARLGSRKAYFLIHADADRGTVTEMKDKFVLQFADVKENEELRGKRLEIPRHMAHPGWYLRKAALLFTNGLGADDVPSQRNPFALRDCAIIASIVMRAEGKGEHFPTVALSLAAKDDLAMAYRFGIQGRPKPKDQYDLYIPALNLIPRAIFRDEIERLSFGDDKIVTVKFARCGNVLSAFLWDKRYAEFTLVYQAKTNQPNPTQPLPGDALPNNRLNAAAGAGGHQASSRFNLATATR